MTESLKIHQESQQEHDGLRYACDHCEHLSKTKHYLFIHKNIKHGNVKYYCGKCDLQIRNGGKLKGRQ